MNARRPFLCIGHRGAAGHAPENTLLSIRRALELGADWVEVDVHPLGGELVVIHDDTLDRTTNGSGALSDWTLDEVRRLDAGSGERVPLLPEVLDLLRGRAGLVVELKGRGAGALAAPLLRGALRSGWERADLTASSFHADELRSLRSRAPEVPLAVLARSADGPAMELAREVNAQALHLPLRGTLGEDLERARSMGLPVLVFTVNLPEDIRTVYHMGAAGVFTDYPERVAEALGGRLDL
ncbi:MAG: glycerophosphodiester phosphodiesterase [Acidobacteriota bacterium]